MNIVFLFSILFSLSVFLQAEEFVVSKKNKKESAAVVKDDIVELLESTLRQLGSNIQQAVGVQNQVMDMLRTVMEGDHSVDQLKETRNKLEKNLKMLEEQQKQLQTFFQ